MKKRTSRFSNSTRNKKLRQMFMDDPELIGELVDAMLCNQVAADLYKLRKSVGLTQAELAETLGIKQSNISRWETPGYQGYKVKILSKIVRTLGGRLTIRVAPPTTYSHSLRFGGVQHDVLSGTYSLRDTRQVSPVKESNYERWLHA